MKKDPSQEQLLKDTRYEQGNLFWLPRGYGRFDKQFAGKKIGCIASSGYGDRKHVVTNYKNGCHLVHRLIWIYHNGEIFDQIEIDHINNDSLDNRIENLRLATSLQNNYNMPLRKDNKSGIKGVYWNEATKNWRVRIGVNKKPVHIGLFNHFDDAVKAVTAAREKYHGHFANNGNITPFKEH